MTTIKYASIKIYAVFIMLISANSYGIGNDIFDIGINANADFNFNNIEHSGTLSDLEFIDGFNNRPLLDISLALHGGRWNFYTEATILSLRAPIILDFNSLFTNMVRRAYLEYTGDFLYFSVGRRKQSIGAAGYNLFVNRDMPFYDGINISIGKEIGFRFDSLVSWANLTRYIPNEIKGDSGWEHSGVLHSKYFMYHDLAYVGPTWFLMIGEASSIANPASLSDFNVFGSAHNEHSSRVNVALEIQGAKIFFDKLMIYGELGIDDVPTPASSTGTDAAGKVDHPDAIAFGLGVRYHLLEGETFEYPSFDPDKGIRKNINFGLTDTGLVLGFDYIVATRWMYKKSSSHTAYGDFRGQLGFYNYFYTPNLFAGEDWYAVPYGLKYGGDSQLIALSAHYTSQKLTIDGAFNVVLQGWEGRETAANLDYMGEAELSDDPDSPLYSINWFSSGNIKPQFQIQAQAEYGFFNWLSAYAGFKFQFSSFNPFVFNINIGGSVRF
ncbi:hypothetical protein FACS1894164_02080 [Spirochaetia bacterium]|nr:hypothetical protein FACS1894164_02080 [Spirochaetia bacterium]